MEPTLLLCYTDLGTERNQEVLTLINNTKATDSLPLRLSAAIVLELGIRDPHLIPFLWLGLGLG